MGAKSMQGYLAGHPDARRAFFGQWRDVWKARVDSGAYSESEEDDVRRDFLEEVAGVRSTSDLTKSGYHAVMLALKMELAVRAGKDGERKGSGADFLRNQKVWRIRKIAEGLVSDGQRPDDYIATVVRRTCGWLSENQVGRWYSELGAGDLHKLLLTMRSQERRNGEQ